MKTTITALCFIAFVSTSAAVSAIYTYREQDAKWTKQINRVMNDWVASERRVRAEACPGLEGGGGGGVLVTSGFLVQTSQEHCSSDWEWCRWRCFDDTGKSWTKPITEPDSIAECSWWTRGWRTLWSGGPREISPGSPLCPQSLRFCGQTPSR